MISISTIITYYKTKYSAIGRAKNRIGPGEDVPMDDDAMSANYAEVARQLGIYADELYVVEAAQGKFNQGLLATTTLQETLAGKIGSTVAQMTFLEEREKNLIGKFQVGSNTLYNRTKAYGNMQGALQATSDDMAVYRSILEETAPLTGKIFEEIAKGIPEAPNLTGKTDDQITEVMAKRAAAMKDAQAYVESESAAAQWIDKNTTLTAEQTQALKLYSAGQDKSLAKTVLNIRSIAKAYGNIEDPVKLQNVILSEIANTSADVRAQYSKMPMGLEKAVLKARQLGISMDQVHKIGESFLDIESSVGKELEYQLLSGQRLVKNGKSLTNAYREATLMGDADKSIDALNDILDSQKNVLDGTNMYAKKALADQMGISTKELQMMHEKKKLQDDIKKNTGKDVDFDKMSEKEKDALKIELASNEDKTVQALAAAMDDANRKERAMETPADTIKRQMQFIIDNGLLIHMDPDNRKTAAEQAFNYKKEAQKQFNMSRNESVITQQGELMFDRQRTDLVKTNVDTLTKSLPLFGESLTNVTAKITEWANKLKGTPIQVSTIPYINANNVTVKKGGDGDFARGGLLDGPSHAQGGIPTAFGELEGGEAVINKRSTQKFMPLLSSINEAGGGRSFAKGGVLNTKDSGDVNKQLMVLIDKIANMKTADTPNINTNEIIAAITRAMGSVKFDVNVSVDPLDPLKFKKEIEFRSGNLNSVSYK